MSITVADIEFAHHHYDDRGDVLYLNVDGYDGRTPGCSRTAGAVFDYYCNLSYRSDGSEYCSNLAGMGRQVDVDDLLDANGVADLLDLAHRNTVSVYQHRYDDMPRPVRDFGDRRTKLWLRSEIAQWAANLAARGRTRRKLRSGR
jgi:hypothetical protein